MYEFYLHYLMTRICLGLVTEIMYIYYYCAVKKFLDTSCETATYVRSLPLHIIITAGFQPSHLLPPQDASRVALIDAAKPSGQAKKQF